MHIISRFLMDHTEIGDLDVCQSCLDGENFCYKTVTESLDGENFCYKTVTESNEAIFLKIIL